VKKLVFAVSVLALAGCSQYGDSITAEELEGFFRQHKVDGNYAVALKKHSAGESYLVTVHGYPNNLAVCEQLIAPYNKGSESSVIPGTYYCEVLR